jgi:hypothetical protein
MDAPLLIDAIPELAEELKILLVKSEFSNIASQVAGLHIVDRCQCGEKSCATFYTAAAPEGEWGSGHENIMLDAGEGFLILDLLDRNIICVEVLDRREIKQKLDKILPLKKY